MPLSNVVVFDFETTGFDAHLHDRIIEVAAVKYIDRKPFATFSTVIKPGNFTGLPPKITELTGITDDEVDAGMDELVAIAFLRAFISDSVIVAHNAGFDMFFLHYALIRNNRQPFDNRFIDTLTIARDRQPYPHTLAEACARYGITLDGAHRALNDVYACGELLFKMHDEKPIDDYINVLGYKKKYGPPKWHPEYAALQPGN